MTLDTSYKTILRVAVPLMISSFIQSIVLITDAAFVSRHSTLEFDAVGNGGLIYVTLVMALTGLGDGAQIIMARRIGQNNYSAIGRIVGTSFMVHFVVAMLFFFLAQYTIPSFLMSSVKNKMLGHLQGDFIQIRSYALFFAMIQLTLQAFYLAKGKTWVVLIGALITACSNIILDYLLIFGIGPFPEMGMHGAALASTMAEGIGMSFLLLFTLFSKDNKQYNLFKYFTVDVTSIKELLRTGSPLMLQGFVAIATWTLFFSWIEQIGTYELTISQNIRAIYFLAFVPIWGFAGTTKTYISQYLGRKDFGSLRQIQRRIQLLTMLFLLLFFHGALFYPEKIIALINPSIIHVKESAEILRFIFCSILMFGFFSVYFQTINGSGNTIISFSVEILCLFFYLTTAYVFIKMWQLPIFYIWSVEYIYFGCLGLFSIIYLSFFDWKQKVV